MSIVVAIVVTGAGTYLMRALFILLLAEREFPALAQRVLGYVAPAVMAALVVSMLVRDGEAQIVGWPALVGLATTVAVASFTRSHVVTLVAAMATYWVLSAL
ncbi:MAG: AzlD domain-containing protein [Pseudomonadota bacterium]